METIESKIKNENRWNWLIFGWDSLRFCNFLLTLVWIPIYRSIIQLCEQPRVRLNALSFSLSDGFIDWEKTIAPSMWFRWQLTLINMKSYLSTKAFPFCTYMECWRSWSPHSMESFSLWWGEYWLGEWCRLRNNILLLNVKLFSN